MELKNLILTFLIANSLFWGLFPHEAHCLVINYFNRLSKMNIKCSTHKVHIIMGICFYIVTVFYAQKDSKHLKH